MPWIVGETAFSANDRYEYPHTGNGPEHHAWPYMHSSEAKQSETGVALLNYHAWGQLQVSDVTVSATPDPGATLVDFAARQEVHVQSEFHAEQGSEVHIHLAEVFPPCGDESFRAFDSMGHQDEPLTAEKGMAERQVKLSFQNPVANDIRVYPNPAKRRLFIEVPHDEPCVVRIIDSAGSVSHVHNSSTGSLLAMDLPSLSSGFYVIEVEQGGKKWTSNVMINSFQP